MNAKHKLLSALALTAGLLLGLAGCGEAPAQTAETAGFTPTLDEDTACEIRVAGSYSNFEALESAFDSFNAFYPNVILSYTSLDNYNSTISTALEGEDAPDIYVTNDWMIQNPGYQGLLDRAEDLSAAGVDLSAFREGLIYRDEAGKVPMVPIFSTTYGLLVNQDLFQREGLEIPQTWSGLLSVCRSLREAGYESPVLGYTASPHVFNSLTYPSQFRALENNAEAVAALNALEPGAAEYTRSTLELVDAFMSAGCMDPEVCAQLEDGHSAMILRFFEGDVPMLLCSGDTVSGTAKRESLSEAFTENPFSYAFYPVPITEEGGLFLDMPSISFSVNPESGSLDMTNEFMRFLANEDQLNAMAQIKGLLSAAAGMDLDGVYAPFAEFPADRVLSTLSIGLMDAPLVQTREAAYAVGMGQATVDEALAAFGSYVP